MGIDPNVPDGEMILDQVQRPGTPASTSGRWATSATGSASANSSRTSTRPRRRLPGIALHRSRRAGGGHPALDEMLGTFDTVRRTCPGRRRIRRSPTPAAGNAAPAVPVHADRSLGLDADGWRGCHGLARGRPLSRPWVRADVPPGDRDQRGGALGDPAGARQLRRRALPGDRAHDARRRRPGRPAPGLGGTRQPRAPQGRLAVGQGPDRGRRRAGDRDLVTRGVPRPRRRRPRRGRGARGLRGMAFGGWLVVEQDILPRSAARFARAAEEQRLNRAFLAARGL